MRERKRTVCVVLIGVVATFFGCRTKEPASAGAPPAPTATVTPNPATALKEATEKNRLKYASLSFEEFKSSEAVYKEPFPGGKYIVNGDTPIVNEKALREFYEKKVRTPPTPTPRPGALIVFKISGVDQVWNQNLKRSLTYCVSKPGFGARYAAVVSDMEAATSAWEQVADVDFKHVTAQDSQCTASNAAVVFDVRPVDVGGEYLARAFFPNEPRASRNVLIDKTALELAPGDKPQLVGILRHELGHALGFRHEHTRPAAGRCFEDTDWGVLTDYDPDSVMHYPQCNGTGDWSLTLTSRDKNGAGCLYGPAAGVTVDMSLIGAGVTCAPALPAAGGQTKTESMPAQAVQKDAQKSYGPFTVVPGSLFEASIGGPGSSGDPDLYVRFGTATATNEPAVDAYDCRPYLDGPTETCALNVPDGKTKAWVMVRGYEDGTYGLRVVYVSPAN